MYTGLDRIYLRMRLDRLETMLVQLGASVTEKEIAIMATVEELNAAVADLTVSVDAAVAAISKAASASGIDPAELDAAVAAIKQQAGKLNDAVHAAGM
jgi:hypothetical protein